MLASGPPTISADGKTVTVHIKSGFRFSPPVNRPVTSADVAYAFQRMFNPNVQNAYAAGYFPIVGAAKAAGKPIPGISTPNKTTIVFHLTKNFGATMAEALTLPATAAVPESYAAPMDKSSPSKYDSDPTKQAFTGPYMIKSYTAGRSLTLVRNPNWSRTVDGVRPAYADKIVWNAGADATVAAHQTLDSTNLLMADTPPSSVLKTAYEQKKTQLSIQPLGTYYAALNTQRAHRSTTSTCARRRSPTRTGRPTSWPAAASSWARWPRTSSIPRCRASSRPAARPDSARTTSNTRPATTPWPAST